MVIVTQFEFSRPWVLQSPNKSERGLGILGDQTNSLRIFRIARINGTRIFLKFLFSLAISSASVDFLMFMRLFLDAFTNLC